MQPDNRAHPGETPPLPPPPSSPTLPSGFHRHHPQPTPTDETDDPLPSMRHRPPESHTVRINVQAPFSDSGSSSSRRKEGYPVRWSMAVREVKDEVARGAIGDGDRWERDGMRLVWQGRIIRDEERVGEVVGNTRDPSQTVHTFHLVARRVPAKAGPASAPMARPHPATVPTPTASAPPSGSSKSLNTIALRDTVHYLLFTARHHLCHLISAPILLWDDMVPAPTIEQDRAREAVMTVVRACADQCGDQDESWQKWEGAFEGDDSVGLEEVWSAAGGREKVQQEVKELWESRVGRKWREGEHGESVAVELDDLTYQLHIPPAHFTSPTQLTHLFIYLRITSLVPLLINVLEDKYRPSTNHTAPQPDPDIRVVYRRTFRLRLPRIPMPVIQHVFFSSLKLLAMMWMLTRDMRWDDMTLWIMVGGAMGWWFGDALNRYHQERRRNPLLAPPQPAEALEIPNAGGDVPAQAAVNAAVRPRIHRPRNPAGNNLLTSLIALAHLDVDAAQLRLPGPSTHQPTDADPARAPPIPRQPPRWTTQFFLPILLWVLTLFPEFEAIRARAIRRRERTMRVLVGELSANPEVPLEEGQEPRRIYPEGLHPTAKAYYERVMERGEAIDWEEERQAQIALGAVEDAEEGGGLGLGF